MRMVLRIVCEYWWKGSWMLLLLRAAVLANMASLARSLAPPVSSAAATTTTILGFGSLLSERSSRVTFPDLTNFRLVRVQGYRRVFQHPASIFFSRGIADRDSGAFCSLSAEPCDEAAVGFVASAFEVRTSSSVCACVLKRALPVYSTLPRSHRPDPPTLTAADPVPPFKTTHALKVIMTPEARDAFELREEEFEIVSAPYSDLDAATGRGVVAAITAFFAPLVTLLGSRDNAGSGGSGGASDGGGGERTGLLCTPSTDDAYRQKHGATVFDERYRRFGLERIWGWPRDSGITPCGVYLRHCVLAADGCGAAARDSFLDEASSDLLPPSSSDERPPCDNKNDARSRAAACARRPSGFISARGLSTRFVPFIENSRHLSSNRRHHHAPNPRHHRGAVTCRRHVAVPPPCTSALDPRSGDAMMRDVPRRPRDDRARLPRRAPRGHGDAPTARARGPLQRLTAESLCGRWLRRMARALRLRWHRCRAVVLGLIPVAPCACSHLTAFARTQPRQRKIFVVLTINGASLKPARTVAGLAMWRPLRLQP